jgi:MFS family permease
MPVVQVLLLCYSALAEPVAYFSIFPFINEMLERNGDLPEEEVGYWSGAIESLFSLVQMVLMIFYGRMADRVGRKPVLVFSLAGVSVATALFGLSKSVWQMIAMRCLAGVFAGSVVTIRTMLSEITNKKTQGRAFSWYMFARNFGILIGPLIGAITIPRDALSPWLNHHRWWTFQPSGPVPKSVWPCTVLY